jgi:cytochrome c553
VQRDCSRKQRRACGRFRGRQGKIEDVCDLVKALNDYKSGTRKNPIMAPQAANLSNRDIADLAAFFSQQRGLQVKY